MYAVESSADRNWHRGRVTKINVDSENLETYEVFFVDIGSTESKVEKSKIRRLNPSLTIYNPLAEFCTFPEIAPVDGSWSKEAIEAFKAMVWE